MAGTKRPVSSSPVPSITLQVSKTDAEQFLRASSSISARMIDLRKDGVSTVEIDGTPSAKPLHEMLYQAAITCEDSSVGTYRDRLRLAFLTEQEQQASFLLFHRSEFDEKLRAYIRALHDSSQAHVPHAALVSFFRTVLASIVSCCATEKSQIVVEGKPDRIEEPPRKRVKREEDTASGRLTPQSSDPSKDLQSCQAPSFDCSLATLQDEDNHDNGVRKEIEEVAQYAADQLEERMRDRQSEMNTFDVIKGWYAERGNDVVPWLELISFSRWESVGGSSPQPNPPSVPSTSEDPKRVNDHFINAEPTSSFIETSEPYPLFEDKSKPLVSFDFSGSGHPKPLCIEISENNLYALRNFVHRTGLMHCSSSTMCKKLLRMARQKHVGDRTMMTLSHDQWMKSISNILGVEVWHQLSSVERKAFNGCLSQFFQCFAGSKPFLGPDEVDVQEFAVGFCFFCAGNKSTKLATGFEMLDNKRRNYLSEERLQRYLYSYLTVLVAMSMLAPITKYNSTGVTSSRKHYDVRSAVETGARWTLGHFLRHFDDHDREVLSNKFTFESFATWYSSGGYEIAPWLELLDLNKVFSLIGPPGLDMDLPPPPEDRKRPANPKDKMSSLRRHHSGRKGPPPEILFTFPLDGHRSLIVLKEDATYVKGVVEHLGLLSITPDDLWSQLSAVVEKQKGKRDYNNSAVYVTQEVFVNAMEDVCPELRKNKSNRAERSRTSELLSNFFQCFDLEQQDNVALDELMGGLTLLCGGKKSHKLAFAFGVFDTRPGIQQKKAKESVTHSLSGEDLFLFLRSILIVTFSCCRQSLDMTDGMVGRCITDTANWICNDVMRHQWDLRHKDRLNFDEFGQWYNDGGFKSAPWLELLDLKKWVLVDSLEGVTRRRDPEQTMAKTSSALPDVGIPPPPPEDALDPDFFETGIMPMDSMDDMDMILMQPSSDRDSDLVSPRITHDFAFSPTGAFRESPGARPPPLRFHLNTIDEHGGYTLSLSHRRISHLRRILECCVLHTMEAESLCNRILSKASKSKTPRLSRDAFASVVDVILAPSHPGARRDDSTMREILFEVFASFDRDGIGKVSAIEIACGLTVLCDGKKSDKLEFAFEVLDKRKCGRLSKDDMTNYLRSFLTVLLSIAFASCLNDDAQDDTLKTLRGQPCDQSSQTISRVVRAGADWAASMAFGAFHSRHHVDSSMSMSFDDFADWYTKKGFSSIPWLELLDLRKWVFTKETT